METNNAKYICESYFNIGGLYFEMGKYEDARVYYEKSFDFAQKRNLLKDEMDALFALSELYEVQNKPDLSLIYLHKYIDLQDSYYATIAKESSLSNELLESIKEMELSNDLKDQQMKLLESELRQDRMWYIVFIIAGLTAAILLILFVFKKKIN
jgi:tetratricopeptide (TPR) repeat protein